MILALLTLAACVTRESFFEQYAAAKCDFMERCDIAWEENAEAAGVDSCEAAQELVFANETLTPGWTPEAGAACLDWTRDTRECDGDVPDDHPCAGLWE